MNRIVFLIFLILPSLSVLSQALQRQALIDYNIKYNARESFPVSIGNIPETSGFYKAGLRKNDILVSINTKPVNSGLIYQQATRRWRAGGKIILGVKREGRMLTIVARPEPKPLEQIENCISVYDKVKTKDGFEVSMIITKPRNASGKLPVIFFVQWLSCDQVEINRNNMDGWAYLIEDLASKTGYIMIRTEKPGLGDSNGPDCSACDLATEINAYKAAFQKILTYDFIDRENIIVVGGSIGGALAPVVAEGQKIKGIISTGGFSTTWYEHILDFERTRLFYSGTKPEYIDSLVKKFSSFYYEYLIRKKRPSTIISTDPSYKDLWYQSDDLQFGRPVKYYQQLQDLNMSYFWSKINCPVLVVYGEYDWIMSEAEQENIARLLNTKKPGTCELIIIPQMNHHYSKYANAQEAFNEPAISYEPAAFETMKKWMTKLVNE